MNGMNLDAGCQRQGIYRELTDCVISFSPQNELYTLLVKKKKKKKKNVKTK